ncbi:hypothetical protein AGOR_G00072680 [Albula goreensis]|uniref:B30.2/SPRY domain-containing protein n=1 Tax=Albula goreensis TaxID=1534307 RepID=A0A8T3DQG6_9TELE|nr:hypothetical protein AGOR_G00072680 [Albula goreensis]
MERTSSLLSVRMENVLVCELLLCLIIVTLQCSMSQEKIVLANTIEGKTHLSRTPQGNASLLLTHVTQSDNGDYYCVTRVKHDLNIIKISLRITDLSQPDPLMSDDPIGLLCKTTLSDNMIIIICVMIIVSTATILLNFYRGKEKEDLTAKMKALSKKDAFLKEENKALSEKNEALQEENKALCNDLGKMTTEREYLTAKNKAQSEDIEALQEENKAQSKALGKITEENDDLKAKNKALSNNLGKITKEKEDLTAKNRNLTDFLGKAFKFLDDKKEDEDLKTKTKSLSKENECLKEENKGLSVDHVRIAKANEDLKAENQVISMDCETTFGENEYLKAKNEALSADLGKIIQENGDLKSKNNALSMHLGKITEENDDQKAKNKALSNNLGMIRKEMEDLTARNRDLSDYLGKVTKEKEDLTTKNKALSEELGMIKKENKDLRAKNETFSEDLGKMKQENGSLKQDNKSLSEENAALKEKNETFSEDLGKMNQENGSLKQDNKALSEENAVLKERPHPVDETDRLQQSSLTPRTYPGEDCERCNLLRQELDGLDYVLTVDWEHMKACTVEVTLPADPENGSLKIIDGKRVRFVGKEDEDNEEWPGVLGQPVFHSGKHYWEVEVGEKESWRIGISSEPMTGEVKSRKLGKRYWMLQLCDEELSARSAGKEIKLKKDKPWKIGVLVDFDEKKTSFYNTETKKHIHSFNLSPECASELYSYFSPGSNDRDSLTVLT